MSANSIFMAVCLVMIAALATSGVAYAQMARAMVEKPDYDVLEKADGYEIRRYPEMLVAQVRMEMAPDDAMNSGFDPLAGFIFGDNVDESKIEMTSPVTQEADTSTKIAMTSPVTQEADADAQLVRFIMPSEYTMETLPKPTNEKVEILTIPARTVAVIKFSGFGRHEKMLEKQAKLEEALARDEVEVAGDPTYARYDPPWTVPFMRRNEVMIPVAWPDTE